MEHILEDLSQWACVQLAITLMNRDWGTSSRSFATLKLLRKLSIKLQSVITSSNIENSDWFHCNVVACWIASRTVCETFRGSDSCAHGAILPCKESLEVAQKLKQELLLIASAVVTCCDDSSLSIHADNPWTGSASWTRHPKEKTFPVERFSRTWNASDYFELLFIISRRWRWKKGFLP